jgi:choline dehydrogenase-like flavoprotein
MELGREFRAGDFPATPRAMIDAVRIEWCRLTLGDEDALVTFRTGRELHVITARGVGGGSVVSAAVALRPDLNAFARRRWPPGLVEDGELDYDFARVERMPGVATPADATRHARFASLVRAAASLGAQAAALPTAISFAPGIYFLVAAKVTSKNGTKAAGVSTSPQRI